jgi:ribosome-associated protein
LTVEERTEAMKTILEDKKAREVEVISLEGRTTLADYFLIATGGSLPHIRALADDVQLQMKARYGIVPDHVEGYQGGRWILLDYIDIVVHVFHEEDRAYYSLEKLWEGRKRGQAT